MTTERTLLMDGDTIAFMAAAAVQHTLTDEQGFVQPFAKVEQGEAAVDSIIMGLFSDLKGTGLQVYLSDPEGSWRLQLQESYKGNRVEFADEGTTAKVRPLLLGRLKEYLKAKYGAEYWPGLEADDVLGILMTRPVSYPGERIMVGRDKDFNTIPGLHHQIKIDVDSKGRPLVREVSEDFANWFHMVQALAGDRVDGYAGCPKIGMTRAKEILSAPHMLVKSETTVTRGPRKGQTTTKWVKGKECTMWECVVAYYVAAGQTEREALLNARLAHICRAEDYNDKDGSVKLWVP